MKKAFTLVELLAVIVILGIIATITIPIVINVYKTSKEKTFKDSAEAILKSANNYYNSSYLGDEIKLPLLITFNNQGETTKYKSNKVSTCQSTTTRLLDYNGINPDSGNIYIDKEGQVALALYSKTVKLCATKTFSDNNISYSAMSTASSCVLSNNPC
jgi:prepilin-type N-terminal cleavage/methylation domain-containing protein